MNSTPYKKLHHLMLRSEINNAKFIKYSHMSNSHFSVKSGATVTKKRLSANSDNENRIRERDKNRVDKIKYI